VRSHEAQGWYRDPFAVHEDRYFSAGRPTKLVRDGGAEAYDEPPVESYAAEDLVPVDSELDDGFAGSDMRRADDAERRATAPDLRRADDASDEPRSAEVAKRAAFDAFDQMMPPN
jgi:hypothetical protein